MDEARNTPWYAIIHLAFYTGIRRSEMCALRWSDINYEERYLTVNKVRVAARGGNVEGMPKSESSSRLVSFSSDVVQTLSRHMESHLEMFNAFDIQWTENLFCNDRG